MTDPNLTPARLAAFDGTIADALKGTPLTDGRISTSYDWCTDTTTVRARVGLIIEGTVALNGLAVGLGGDAYLEAHAARMGANMRHEWDTVTGAAERRAIVRDIREDLGKAIITSDDLECGRRIAAAMTKLEGLMR